MCVSFSPFQSPSSSSASLLSVTANTINTNTRQFMCVCVFVYLNSHLLAKAFELCTDLLDGPHLDTKVCLRVQTWFHG